MSDQKLKDRIDDVPSGGFGPLICPVGRKKKMQAKMLEVKKIQKELEGKHSIGKLSIADADKILG